MSEQDTTGASQPEPATEPASPSTEEADTGSTAEGTDHQSPGVDTARFESDDPRDISF